MFAILLRNWGLALVEFAGTVKRAVMCAIDHDALILAQATAYASVLALFPALIVAAAILGLLPPDTELRLQLATFFERVLPSTVIPLLESYFASSHNAAFTTWSLVSSGVVSFLGAAGVMTTLMEGFRRAQDLPLPKGSFVRVQLRAFTLVLLALVPVVLVTLLVVFGHVLTMQIAESMGESFHKPVYVLAGMLRWAVAFVGISGIFAVLYHLGTDIGTHVWGNLEPTARQPWLMLRKDWTWRASLPGAAVATGLWLVATLSFGVYVTRFANYSQVYGPLGAGIALLVWMYLIALSVLVGAEFNAQLGTHGPMKRAPEMTEALWKTPSRRSRRTGRMAVSQANESS